MGRPRKSKYHWQDSSYSAGWRRENPVKTLLQNARARSRKYGLAYDIDESDIVIPTHCPVLGIKLEKNIKTSDSCATLDRMDNSKGYVKGNVKVISYRANSIKRNATVEEMEKILKYMKEL